MGRTTILNDAIQAKMVQAIEGGNYAPTAADYAGIGVSTHYDWLKKGESGETPYAEYLEAIKKAEAVAEVRNVTLIQAAAQNTWTAAAWYLERKHYDRWGRKDRNQIELTGANGRPIEINSTRVDARTALLEMLGHTTTEEITEDVVIVEETTELGGDA